MKKSHYIYKFSAVDFCGKVINHFEWDELPEDVNPVKSVFESWRAGGATIEHPDTNEPIKLNFVAVYPFCGTARQAHDFAEALNKTHAKTDTII